MKPDTITISDALSFVQSLPDNSVHCVVTSCPYYGLRDYGTGTWMGGDPNCDHVAGEMRRGLGLASSPASTRGGGKKIADTPDIQYKAECGKCGAKRVDSQIGLEDTPQDYIARMVELFREIRRVLRDDGTCWLNIGDSYWGGQSGDGGKEYQQLRSETGVSFSSPEAHVGGPGKTRPTDRKSDTFKPKDLMMIPARLAIALVDDDWYLRSDIIWHKPNAMPESVTDRPTTAHEHVFLLAKSPSYYYDQEAIREPQTGNTHSRGNGSSPKEIPQHDGMIKSNHSFNSSMTAYIEVPGGRNKRSVWTVPTESNSFAHFAIFPQALVEPMILAGCPAKVCSACGAPYKPIIQKGEASHNGSTNSAYDEGTTANRLALLRQAARSAGGEYQNTQRVIGWQLACKCNAPVESGIVFDPFMGSGTVALVARRLGRHWIGCDLNGDYVKLANERLSQSDPFQDHQCVNGNVQLSLFSE